MVMNAETKGMFLTMGDRTGSSWAESKDYQ